MNENVTRHRNRDTGKQKGLLMLVLAMCPTLAVTDFAIKGLVIGLATAVVLVFSCLVMAPLKRIMPEKSRLLSWLIVSATLVTIMDLLMNAFWLAMYDRLGLYIPLMVINCMILGHAGKTEDEKTRGWEDEKKTKSVHAGYDRKMVRESLKRGTGFVFLMVLLSCVREILGAGSVFGYRIVTVDTPTLMIFITPPGALIALGFLLAGANRLSKRMQNPLSKQAEEVK